tara:strand:+ start:2694 stop:3680 length:987 start_codon:yes stop_codon:yes gene_type:complete
MQRDNANKEKAREELKARQKKNIDGIKCVLESDLFAEKTSRGLVEMNRIIDDDMTDDPAHILRELINLAKQKSGGMKGAVGALKGKQGFIKAGAQAIRGVKSAVGKVNPEVKSLYDLIAKISMKDPYEFEGDSVEIAGKKISLEVRDAKKEIIGEKRKSVSYLGGDLKRHSGLQFFSDNAENASSPEVKQAHHALIVLTDSKKNPNVYRSNSREDNFLYDLGAHLKMATESYNVDQTSSINAEARREYRYTLESVVQEYMAIYHPKNESRGEKPPLAPDVLQAVFAKLGDVLNKKNFSEDDREKIHKLFVTVNNDYVDVESSKPVLKK